MSDERHPVAIEIDAGKCFGMGICEMLAPGVTERDDDGIAHTTGATVPLSLARDLRDNCPSAAIAIPSD
ncbi:ferredoxin [Rhodococcus koreensis]|uniref:ferredoxin n=1 Tax=Rhodococcus koreensis TaxID=99653 RepID=UPI00366BE1E4